MSDALLFASRVHGGQVDKGGEPYVGHLTRVSAKAVEIAKTIGLAAPVVADIHDAALLHDTLEDTDATENDLRAEGFNENVIRMVKALTRDPNDEHTYMEWIEQIASGDLATAIIKFSDNYDNSDPKRIAQLPPENQSIANRYARSMTRLAKGHPVLNQFRRA